MQILVKIVYHYQKLLLFIGQFTDKGSKTLSPKKGIFSNEIKNN